MSHGMPLVEYNEEFDKEHYPIKDWQIEELILVHRHLDLPDCGKWVYFATIHGVIFKYIDGVDILPRTMNRMDRTDLEFFGNRKQLRWFEPTETSFQVAFTHHENEELRVKLHQLQWKIEGQLRGFKDPVARMNKMIELFWQGVNDFQRTLKDVGFGKPVSHTT